MAFVFPTFQKTSARYITELELSGELFRFRFDWNSRETAWYMDIMNTNENNILTNIKIVTEYSLLKQYEYITDLPKGYLLVIDLENKLEDRVTFDGFGSRWLLLFISFEEAETGVTFGF